MKFKKVTSHSKFTALMFAIAALLAGCQSPSGTAESGKKMQLAPQKALNRAIHLNQFMGKWYVIAHIPTFIETEAYNAVESYDLQKDGSIKTTFTFNKGALDGPLKSYNPTGWVFNQKTNTEWRMQFIWPFKAAYLITLLDEKEGVTIISVPNRQYAWIMAREKSIPEKRYTALVNELKNTGHDITKLRRIPHSGLQ